MLDAKFCPACGHHFHSGPIEEPSIDASNIEETKSDTTGKSNSAEVCYNCNTVLEKNALFWGECGAPVREKQGTQS